jgi:hypothetical protein
MWLLHQQQLGCSSEGDQPTQQTVLSRLCSKTFPWEEEKKKIIGRKNPFMFFEVIQSLIIFTAS